MGEGGEESLGHDFQPALAWLRAGDERVDRGVRPASGRLRVGLCGHTVAFRRGPEKGSCKWQVIRTVSCSDHVTNDIVV